MYKLKFVSTSDKEWDRIANLVYNDYPDACIIQIDKIDNPPGQFDYLKRLQELDSCTIIELYHGTKHKHLSSILTNSLLAEYNITSAYGKGTYFSNTIQMSLEGYTDYDVDHLSYVFICSVIKEDAKIAKNIHVCPRDDSFLLNYLVTFNKNDINTQRALSKSN